MSSIQQPHVLLGREVVGLLGPVTLLRLVVLLGPAPFLVGASAGGAGGAGNLLAVSVDMKAGDALWEVAGGWEGPARPLLTLGAGGAAFRLAGRGVALEGLRLPLDL